MIGVDDKMASVMACLAVLAIFWVAAEYALAKLAEWVMTRDAKKRKANRENAN
jgi:hypothetical protein